jgi:hypothetical protein
MLKMRAAAAGPSGGPAPGPALGAAPVGAPAPAVEFLDPNEPGISPKEKARRQMLKMRAEKAGGGTALPASSAAAAAPSAGVPAPAAAEPSAPAAAAIPEDLGDPDEPGISPKERGRRTVARMRRKAAGG